MSNNKPTRERTCRGCAAKFVMTIAGQRYCPACREARAALVEALRVKTCHHCGTTRDDLKLGLCPECRTAIEQQRKEADQAKVAAKLARYNANGGCPCGKPSTNPHDGLCDQCHAERMDGIRNKIKQQRKEAYEKHLDEKRRQQATRTEEEYLAKFAELSPEEKRSDLLFAIKYLLDRMPDVTPTSEPVNPEEEAHADQDSIDREFRDMMGGLDL